MKMPINPALTYSPALERLFANLENGNIGDALRQARRHNRLRLAEFAQSCLGWSAERSLKAAYYLKGLTTFQDYCDAK
jgi:hypothetical protein